MSTEKAPGKESFEQKLKAIVVRIPINATTVTAALVLTQAVIELAQVLKVPLEVEKVAPMQIESKLPPIKVVIEDKKVIQP